MNAPKLTKIINTVSGRIIFIRLIPADFIAVSSEFSAKFPNVMMDERRIAKGKAMGTKLAEA